MNHTETRAIAAFLTTDFENEMHTTLRVLEAVPDGHFDYQPDPKSKTALGLVRHIVLEDPWLLNCIANGEFTPPPDDSDACGIMNPVDAIAYYKKHTPPALDRVRATPDEKFTQVIDMFGAIQTTAINFLSMTAKHSVHHRGQLTAYLRAMGGTVPSVYGPSADSQ